LTALFPPGKGGGEEVAYGGKGKGVLIHTLTEGGGMPLANCTTPANGNEREQIIPLLDKVKLKTLKRGRPRKRLFEKWLAVILGTYCSPLTPLKKGGTGIRVPLFKGDLGGSKTFYYQDEDFSNIL
jgi:hypothetical protein